MKIKVYHQLDWASVVKFAKQFQLEIYFHIPEQSEIFAFGIEIFPAWSLSKDESS